jgi:hypothetical protein
VDRQLKKTPSPHLGENGNVEFPKENAGFAKNPVFINLLEHLFFFR